MYAYLSDAAGSHSEIFRQLGHQIGRFLHVLHATSRGETQVANERPFRAKFSNQEKA
jgi:hypothetical protein